MPAKAEAQIHSACSQRDSPNAVLRNTKSWLENMSRIQRKRKSSLLWKPKKRQKYEHHSCRVVGAVQAVHRPGRRRHRTLSMRRKRRSRTHTGSILVSHTITTTTAMTLTTYSITSHQASLVQRRQTKIGFCAVSFLGCQGEVPMILKIRIIGTSP